MAKCESSPGISPAKRRIRYRSGSNFNAEYTRTFDWVMASDRGKQQAYFKVCSKHFSISHGGIDNVRRHGEGKKHLELFNARKSTNQVTKYYVSLNSSSLDENVIKAETLISLAMATKVMASLRIVNIILKRFQPCFIHILANRAREKFEVKNKSFRELSRIFFRNLTCLA